MTVITKHQLIDLLLDADEDAPVLLDLREDGAVYELHQVFHCATPDDAEYTGYPLGSVVLTCEPNPKAVEL